MAAVAPIAAAPRHAAAERHETVDALRGIASFAVVWFHLTGGDPAFLPDGWLKASGRYGWLGVEVFFVISGFVIPWALWRARYRFGDYPMFLLKRVVRLHPPYLASMLVALAGLWISYLAYAEIRQVGTLDLALHLGYLNALLHRPWINTVYWTLAIEVQYYLLAGLLAVGVAARHVALRRLTVAAFAALTLLPTPGTFVGNWSLLFVLGLSSFQHRAGRIGTAEHLLVVALAGVGLCFVHPPEIVVAGVSTALLISFGSLRHPALLFLGQISYSLYLVHGPVTDQMVRLAARLELDLAQKTVLVLVTTALTLGLAWLLFVLVERPARRWAAALPYRGGASRLPWPD